MLGKRARSTSSSSCSRRSAVTRAPDSAPSPKRQCLCESEFSSSSSPRKRRARSLDPRSPLRYQQLHPNPSSLNLETPNRWRTRSPDCSLASLPPSLPLTQENLRSLEHNTWSMSIPCLAGYNITIDKGIALPETLQTLITTLREARDQGPSPHAQAIIDLRRAAAVENEITARKMLEQHILFRVEGSSDGIKCLTLKDQVNLVKDFLPPPPRITVPELWGSLARPQPDSCLGYITHTEATEHTPAFAMPFTREENDIADWFSVVHDANAHFPFLTAQWKAAISGENQVHASIQAARDGALIVNYMHEFYSLAYPIATLPSSKPAISL